MLAIERGCIANRRKWRVRVVYNDGYGFSVDLYRYDGRAKVWFVEPWRWNLPKVIFATRDDAFRRIENLREYKRIHKLRCMLAEASIRGGQ